MSILSFDQSLTRTGFCFLPGRAGTLDGIVTGSFGVESTSDFLRQCAGVMDSYDAEAIGFEEPIDVIMTFSRKGLPGIPSFSAGNAGQLKLHRIAGHIEGLAFARQKQTVPVNIKSWRAAMLGNGNLPKEKAKAAARQWCQRNGITISNHDEAEACCIAYYAATLTRYHI